MKNNLNFKAWAVLNGLKQKDIANVLGVSLQAVNNKMNGRTEFSLMDVKKLHKAYGVEADVFLH